MIDRELILFFSGLRDRRTKKNIETIFQNLKDFIFVVDESNCKKAQEERKNAKKKAENGQLNLTNLSLVSSSRKRIFKNKKD